MILRHLANHIRPRGIVRFSDRGATYPEVEDDIPARFMFRALLHFSDLSDSQ